MTFLVPGALRRAYRADVAARHVMEPLALGALVGLLLALTGAGGGILAVPLLVFALHLGVAEAAPIGLLAVGLAAAIGAALGLRDGIVRYRAAMLMGGLAMVARAAGRRGRAARAQRAADDRVRRGARAVRVAHVAARAHALRAHAPAPRAALPCVSTRATAASCGRARARRRSRSPASSRACSAACWASAAASSSCRR
jgi:hypothetical protein